MIDDFKYDMSHAILSLFPAGAGFVLEGVDYEGLTWTDVRQKPTKKELEAEMKRLQGEYDSQKYAHNRKAEYDALNQLELISDDSINDTTTHKDAIVAIKAKWPKDNSGPV